MAARHSLEGGSGGLEAQVGASGLFNRMLLIPRGKRGVPMTSGTGDAKSLWALGGRLGDGIVRQPGNRRAEGRSYIRAGR